MAYKLKIRPQAFKALRKIPSDDRDRIIRKIDLLAEEPRPKGANKLKGGDDLYRIRIGDYRVIYQIQDDILLVVIVRVGHRRDAYRK